MFGGFKLLGLLTAISSCLHRRRALWIPLKKCAHLHYRLDLEKPSLQGARYLLPTIFGIDGCCKCFNGWWPRRFTFSFYRNNGGLLSILIIWKWLSQVFLDNRYTTSGQSAGSFRNNIACLFPLCSDFSLSRKKRFLPTRSFATSSVTWSGSSAVFI